MRKLPFRLPNDGSMVIKISFFCFYSQQKGKGYLGNFS